LFDRATAAFEIAAQLKQYSSTPNLELEHSTSIVVCDHKPSTLDPQTSFLTLTPNFDTNTSSRRLQKKADPEH